jgi:hypothetical protein
MSKTPKIAKSSRKRWCAIAVILVIVIGGGATAYWWSLRGPITFEGMVTNADGSCGTDGDCTVTVDNKTVLTTCGWGIGEKCPLKQIPIYENPKGIFYEVPPVGTVVRITAQKDKDDAGYNLHCETCGVTIL